MNITATQTNGKHTAQVSDGGHIVFQTPEYCTAGMALADAKCWLAFHVEVVTMDPALEAARLAGLAAGAKLDAENTVTVSSGTHVLPWEMAYELRKPAPHPRHGFAGEMGTRMGARQQLFKDAAAHLGISYREAQTLPRLLRTN